MFRLVIKADLRNELQWGKVKMYLSFNLFLTAALSLATSLLIRHFPEPEVSYYIYIKGHSF